MKAVLQRVQKASVHVDNKVVGAIEKGLLILLGVGQGDDGRSAETLADKIVNLRIFPDADGKMNLSLLESGGAALVVSQFTLFADCRKGRRPAFVDAAAPEQAQQLYEQFVTELKQRGVQVATGTFRAMMQVHLINDGPVTILLDTREL